LATLRPPRPPAPALLPAGGRLILAAGREIAVQQLSGLDAAFLALESATTPMHIGSASILDPSLAGGGRLDLAHLRRVLAGRLGASRVFRQRLVEVPLGLGKPYWIEDPDFDLDRHLERTRLPEPGGMRQLEALMSWELSQPLPRDRPLWQMILVEGLERVPGVPPGSMAVIGKVHHAAIDGVSGAEIMGALFDLGPTPRPLPADPWEPEPEPGKLALLRRAGRNLLAHPRLLRSTLAETAKGLARAGAAWALERIEPPPLPFTAPRTRWNAPLSKDRSWAGVAVSLARIRAIKEAASSGDDAVTVNDVVLAICAGALRRFLAERDELPDKPLIAMVPVSVRSADERGAMGNQVSAMLVDLATGESDAGARLKRIHRNTHRAKTHHRALGARTLMDYSRIIPFSVAALAARLYVGTGLAARHRPLFNLVITNVPGPRQPLYLAGARLLRHLGAGPIFDGMGLILAVMSYAGELSIGVTSCRRMLEDASAFTRALEASLDELEAAVLAPP